MTVNSNIPHDMVVELERVMNLREIVNDYKCSVCLNLMIDPVQVS